MSFLHINNVHKRFGETCLPPVRINTRLREAPSARQTIFEYAPESNGAKDYASLVSALDATLVPQAVRMAG